MWVLPAPVLGHVSGFPVILGAAAATTEPNNRPTLHVFGPLPKTPGVSCPCRPDSLPSENFQKMPGHCMQHCRYQPSGGQRMQLTEAVTSVSVTSTVQRCQRRRNDNSSSSSPNPLSHARLFREEILLSR